MLLSECPYCPYKTQFSFAFIHHINNQHKNINEEDDYKVFTCTATKLAPYSCNHCQFITDTKTQLSNHLKVKHLNNIHVLHLFDNVKVEPEDDETQIQPHNCSNCDFTTYSHLIYSKHINEFCPISHNYKRKTPSQFKCGNCTYKAVKKHYLTNHIIMKHSKIDEKDYFKCAKCQFKTKLKCYLTLHINRNHNKHTIGEFPCSQCTYIANKLYNLRIHHHKKHSRYKPKIERFQCEQCSYVGNFKYNLQKHVLRKHTDVNMRDYFKCHACLYRSKVESDVKKHIKRVHDLKNLRKCEQCPFTTCNSKNLKQHVKFQHEDIDWVQCELCEYKGRDVYVLKRHFINKHTPSDNIRWFKCEHCNNYKAKHRYNVLQHIRAKHKVI